MIDTKTRMGMGGVALVLIWSSVSVSFSQPAREDTVRAQIFGASADLAERVEVDGEFIRRLTGNVYVQHDSTSLWSNRAFEYKGGDEYLFLHDVLIVDQGDTLRADTVYYEKINKLGRARGNVSLTDGDVTVLAPSGWYYTDEKRAEFREGITLLDSLSELTSLTGIYWTDEKRAEVEGNVLLNSERTRLSADSLTYYRETEVSVARGNVFIERWGSVEEAEADSSIRTQLYGEYAYNDEHAGLSRIRGRPLMLQLREDSARTDIDTLAIRALHLEALEKEGLQRLTAVDSVQIWRRDFAALADSVVYERLEIVLDTLDASSVDTLEETRLFQSPIVWVEEAQVTGDTIRVRGQAGSVDSLFVRSNAFIAQRDSVTNKIQQLKGQHLVGVFEEDSVRTFTVGPNAEAIYFRKNDEERIEGIQASGDLAVFQIKGEKPERIVFSTDIQGTLYPESLVPSPFELEGYQWSPHLRPTKVELLKRLQMTGGGEAPVIEGETIGDP